LNTVTVNDVRHDRQQTILMRLRGSGSASVDDLTAQCGVSAATVRRDLDDLARRGLVHRVHGGAALADGGDPDALLGFEKVALQDTPLKQAVARRAARLVTDGDLVLLDIGTTVQLVALELRGRPVTVATASLAVVDVLRDDPAVELVVLGGLLRRSYHALGGALTMDGIRQIHAQVAVIGTSGLTADGRVLDSTLAEVPVKRALLGAAERSVIVADAHKFPGTGRMSVCTAGQVDVVVTNTSADRRTVQAFRDGGTEVILA